MRSELNATLETLFSDLRSTMGTAVLLQRHARKPCYRCRFVWARLPPQPSIELRSDADLWGLWFPGDIDAAYVVDAIIHSRPAPTLIVQAWMLARAQRPAVPWLLANFNVQCPPELRAQLSGWCERFAMCCQAIWEELRQGVESGTLPGVARVVGEA